MYAPIAQLDRVTDYESVGRGFESLSAYQKNRYPKWDNGFSNMSEGLEQSNAARMSAAGDGLTEPNLYFCPKDRNANESLSAYHKREDVL